MEGCIKRPQTRLEGLMAEMSHRMFFNIYINHWRLKTWPEMIDKALCDLKIRSAGEAVFDQSDSGLHHCQYKIRNVVIGTGSGEDDKIAKRKAMEEAYHRLLKPYCRVVETAKKILKLETSATPFPEILDPINTMEEFVMNNSHMDNSADMANSHTINKVRHYSKFIIVKRLNANHALAVPTTVFQNSARFSGLFYEMDYSFDLETCMFTCTVKVEGHQTAVVTSDQVVKARTLGCEKSMEYLSQFCWTLYVKKKTKAGEKSRDWIESKIDRLKKQGHGRKLCSSNDGNMKLLRKKDLDIKPPGFRTQFEEAIQRVFSDVLDNRESITLLEFPRHEVKIIRKITNAYDCLLVEEKSDSKDGTNKFPRLDIRYMGEGTSRLISIGSNGKYSLESPRGVDPNLQNIGGNSMLQAEGTDEGSQASCDQMDTYSWSESEVKQNKDSVGSRVVAESYQCWQQETDSYQVQNWDNSEDNKHDSHYSIQAWQKQGYSGDIKQEISNYRNQAWQKQGYSEVTKPDINHYNNQAWQNHGYMVTQQAYDIGAQNEESNRESSYDNDGSGFEEESEQDYSYNSSNPDNYNDTYHEYSHPLPLRQKHYSSLEDTGYSDVSMYSGRPDYQCRQYSRPPRPSRTSQLQRPSFSHSGAPRSVYGSQRSGYDGPRHSAPGPGYGPPKQGFHRPYRPRFNSYHPSHGNWY